MDTPYKNRLSKKNKLGRLAWRLTYPILFRPFTLNVFMGWRRLVLRAFGAKIHKSAGVYASVRVWAPWNLEMDERAVIDEYATVYNVDKISLGKFASVSQKAFLCTASHDIYSPAHELLTAPITIGAQAWVAADAFVGMGVTVGEGAVVAARAVVVKDVEAWTIVGGNPATFLKRREMKESK